MIPASVRTRVENAPRSMIVLRVRVHAWSLAALAAVLLVYLGLLGVMPKQVFWSPDEGIKFIMLQTLAGENGAAQTLPYRGASLDTEFKFYPSSNPFPDTHSNYPFRAADGSIRFPWPTWFPGLARIPFVAFGMSGLYVIPVLSGWLTAVVAWRIVSHWMPEIAPAAIVVVGFGTPIFFYSFTFWEHTLAVLLALLALWVVANSAPGKPLPVLLIAPVLTAAVVLRLELFAFAIAVGVAWAITAVAAKANTGPPVATSEIRPSHTWRATSPGTSWALLVALAALAFVLSTGLLSALTPRHQGDIVTYWQVATDNAHKVLASPDFLLRYANYLPAVLIDYAAQDGPATTALSPWLGVMALGAITVGAFVGSTRLHAVLTLPSLLVLLGLSLSTLASPERFRSLHGVFLMAPYAALGIMALPHAWRQRHWSLFYMTCAAVVYLLIGTALILVTRVNWDGSMTTGLEWGPRYLLALYPVSAILALVALKLYWESGRSRQLKRMMIGIGIVMILAGIQFQARGLWMLYNEKQIIAGWQTALETRGDGPVVTDLWWAPASLATYFVSHEMFVVRPENASEWLTLAASRGVTRFTYLGQSTAADVFGSEYFQLLQEDMVRVPGMNVLRLAIHPLSPAARRVAAP